MTSDEQTGFDDNAFDVALGLIENRVGRGPIRKAVRAVLDVRQDSDLSTHKAVLQLATSKGRRRLVTTNFDRAFELAESLGSGAIDYAPYLPLPGNTWNSVVHLHGGLGNRRDQEGESLVLTSADFGRAYITEAWASRFLTELFRRASAVLFIGYSVSDPAIRYIIDAFAADRAYQDARIAKAYLLTSASVGLAVQDERTWRSRGIEPIIYDPRDDHRLLHETLQRCAKRYRSGFFDRESIILEYGAQSPLAGLEQEAISQITWALMDGVGHAARRFAELKPAPPLDWLEFLEGKCLLKADAQLQYAFPPVASISASQFIPPLHPVPAALCHWLCNHLAEPKLAEWVIKNGGHLHPYFADRIRERLANAADTHLPKGAVLVWQFLSARVPTIYSPAVAHNTLLDGQALQEQDWSPLLRDMFLHWLTPTIRLGEVVRWDTTEPLDLELVKSYASVELIPAVGDGSWDLAEQILARPDIDRIARELVGEVTGILHRGRSYLAFLQKANEHDDGTFSDQPSIDDHPQNDRLHAWTAYVHLLREFWERVVVSNEELAHQEVARWAQIPYPLFRRLVLWSAGKSGGLSPGGSVEYLRKQPESAFWGLDTRRELLQYLGRIASQLSPEHAELLTDSICQGPPRTRYRTDLGGEDFLTIRDNEIQLRLTRLREGGLALPRRAQEQLEQILKQHPEWSRQTDERDEFVVWVEHTTGGIDHRPTQQSSDYRDWSDELVIADLRANPCDPQTGARWRGLLFEDAKRAVRMLDVLGGSNFFESDIWAIALDHLGGEPTTSDCVRLFGTFCPNLGPEFIDEKLYQLTGVIDRYCRGKATEEDGRFWRLWDLLLEPAAEATSEQFNSDPVMTALNAPIGHLTDSLLMKLGQLNPRTYEQISLGIQDRLSSLLIGSKPAYRLSRVLLARALAWLYGIKRELVEPAFLHRFDWAASDEARSLWCGYLISPRITHELWSTIRPFFLEVFPHSQELERYEDQFYSFFAFLLLHEEFPLEATQARHALTVASSKGRAHVAWYWWRQADSATDYGANLFRERLRYLLTSVWPLELELREEAASKNLARLASCCGTEFENAVSAITPLLGKTRKPHEFIWSFKDKGHAERYPAATLSLIDSLIGNEIEGWGWRDLEALLTRISTADANLAVDPRLLRLRALVQQFE